MGREIAVSGEGLALVPADAEAPAQPSPCAAWLLCSMMGAYLDANALSVSIGCVIYAAKSTEDRHGSIPEQLADCRSAIEGDPGRVVSGEYVNKSFSAYSADLGPGLLEAMHHCEDIAGERETAELWVQHSDRLARVMGG